MQQVMPSNIAAQRMHEWPSVAAARTHFQIKDKFAAFHPRVLSDYLAHGLYARPDQTTVTLSFKREIEAHIYNTMPHRLLPNFRQRPFLCPAAFIGGQQSKELRKVGLSGTRALFGEQMSWIDGTHLYPFEQPALTAQEVLKWLQQFAQHRHAA